MPEYTYQCQTCGEVVVMLHSIRESPEVLCPQGHGRMEHVIMGGGHLSIQGGKPTEFMSRTHEAKHARDVAKAESLVAELSHTLRPKMKAAAEGRPLPSTPPRPTKPDQPS